MAVVVYVPSRLGEGFFTDLPAPTAGDDTKAITYDHGTGAFVYAAAGGGTPGGATTQVQYNNAGAFAGDAGMTYDAANDRLTVGSASATKVFVTSAWDLVTDEPTGGLIFGNVGGVANDSVIALTSSELRYNASSGFSHSFRVFGTEYLNISSSGVSLPKITLTNTSSSAAVNGIVFNDVGGAANDVGIWRDTDGYSINYDTGNVGSHNFYNGASTLLVTMKNTGFVGFGTSSPTAVADLAASTTARASLRVRAGTAPTTPEDGDMWNDGNAYAMRVNGTNAVNTDGGLSIWMQSSTTARNVGRLLWQYTDKTDASRVTKGALTAYYQSTERKAIHWSADASGPTLSFGPVTTPIATPVLATGASATPDDIIQVLQNLGLVKQS